METQEELSLREWITPTFERVPLNEALLGEGGPIFDGENYQS
ncbi:MAG: hypothetical protein RBT75_22025 [Anaerolineae bacterium]|jgi:hypothetical protein|nr:hypothetical protein [Anaerolineae bacterium]